MTGFDHETEIEAKRCNSASILILSIHSLGNAEDGPFAFVSSTELIGFSCLRAGLSGMKAWWRAAVLLSSDLPS